MNYDFVIASPKNENAMIAANIGEVLFRNANFESDIILTARLKMKKVIVPVTDLIMMIFQYSSGTLVRLTLSLNAIP